MRHEIEHNVLGILFAENGNVRRGVELATAAGITMDAFATYSHRVMFGIAASARDAAHAHYLARLAAQKDMLDGFDPGPLLASWYWSEHDLTRELRRLRGLVLQMQDVNEAAIFAQLKG